MKALPCSGDNGVKLVVEVQEKRGTKINFSFIQNEKHLLERKRTSGQTQSQRFTLDLNIHFFFPSCFYAHVLPGVTLPELNLNHCGRRGNWAYLIHLLYLIKLLLVCCSELKLDPELLPNRANKRETASWCGALTWNRQKRNNKIYFISSSWFRKMLLKTKNKAEMTKLTQVSPQHWSISTGR